MNDPEIDHTYQLFYDVEEGRQAVENGDEPETLKVCRGTTSTRPENHLKTVE